MKPVTSFQRKYRPFSNFWPCAIIWAGIVYPTLEHAFFASALKDRRLQHYIRTLPTPAEAKNFVEKNNLMTTDWTLKKQIKIMEELLWQKFSGSDPLLTRFLMGIGRRTKIVEGNNWGDIIWGVYKGKGDNNLGKLLMKTKEKLFLEKEKICKLLKGAKNNKQVAHTLGISERELYHKLLAFNIPNKEYWIQDYTN